jgi:hypothetical protein
MPRSTTGVEVDAVAAALRSDRTIDIVTTGARTGLERTTEIWFTNIDGRIIICGTPSASGEHSAPRPRDWLANLRAHPDFLFCFKESLTARIPARAGIVRNPDDRRAVMSAPATRWYREQGFSIDDLVRHSPIVEVGFLGPWAALTPVRRHLPAGNDVEPERDS